MVSKAHWEAAELRFCTAPEVCFPQQTYSAWEPCSGEVNVANPWPAVKEYLPDVILCFIIRNRYLVFVPVPGIVLQKPLEFPK